MKEGKLRRMYRGWGEVLLKCEGLAPLILLVANPSAFPATELMKIRGGGK